MCLQFESGRPFVGGQHFHCGQVFEGEVSRCAGVAHIIGLEVRLQDEVGLEVSQGESWVFQVFQRNPRIYLNRQGAELGFQIMKRVHFYFCLEFERLDFPGVQGFRALDIRVKIKVRNPHPFVCMKLQRE